MRFSGENKACWNGWLHNFIHESKLPYLLYGESSVDNLFPVCIAPSADYHIRFLWFIGGVTQIAQKIEEIETMLPVTK